MAPNVILSNQRRSTNPRRLQRDSLIDVSRGLQAEEIPKQVKPKTLKINSMDDFVELLAVRVLWLDVRPDEDFKDSLIKWLSLVPIKYIRQIEAEGYVLDMEGVHEIFTAATTRLSLSGQYYLKSLSLFYFIKFINIPTLKL